jgi:hypothetical protein
LADRSASFRKCSPCRFLSRNILGRRPGQVNARSPTPRN